MLIPNEDGSYVCEKDDFETDSVFEYLDHAGVEFTWGVRLSKSVSLDMFKFLSILNEAAEEGDQAAMYELIDSATLLLVNASSDEVDEYIEECIVRASMGDVMKNIEEILSDNK